MSTVELDTPPEISRVTKTLRNKGFEAYLVGGCVRDLVIGKTPKDWDVATNAAPEEIQDCFEKTYYTNDFGTVGVVFDDVVDERLKVIEVTPYRLEGEYSDARRPDSVMFSPHLADDLKRRDFTINALAYNEETGDLIDNFEGIQDLRNAVIRAVGDPTERFKEDALRIMRAVRLSAELGFAIEAHTRVAIEKMAQNLGKISKERIRDELVRILNSPRPMDALATAQNMGVLKYICPEFERGIGVEQNQAHKHDVFEHLLRTTQHAADKDWDFAIRLAGLFHDISKPETRRWSDEKKDWTFHGHEVVGARVTRKALEELRFSRETIERVVKLVRWHMFFSDPDKITLAAVRRIIRNVGPENIEDLLNLRICDRIGTGRPKEQPFRFRKYKSMVEEALRDPTSVAMLKVNGRDLMEIVQVKPGPRMGWILHALLEEVLDDPKKNEPETLLDRAREYEKLPDDELKILGKRGKTRVEEEEREAVAGLREKYGVK